MWNLARVRPHGEKLKCSTPDKRASKIPKRLCFGKVGNMDKGRILFMDLFCKIHLNLKSLLKRLSVRRNLTKAQEQKKGVRGVSGGTLFSSRVLVYYNVFWQEAIREGAKVKSWWVGHLD